MIAYNSRRNGGLFMKKVNLTLEEAELMNYDDIAHLILEANGKKMKINDLFAEVGKILELEEEEYISHIGDFFELLSTDKRFIMLEDGYWDLKIKHNKGIENFDEDEEEEDIILEDEEVEGDEEMYDEEMNKADDDVQDDDLSDLVIVDDIEDEANL